MSKDTEQNKADRPRSPNGQFENPRRDHTGMTPAERRIAGKLYPPKKK